MVTKMVASDFWQQWIKAHTVLEDDTKWLGENGWTIPMWSDPRIVADLRNASGDIDKAFIRAYTADGSKRLGEL